MDWFEFACDLCEDVPARLGDVLEVIIRSLLFVKHNFSPEVLQNSLRTLLLPSEVIYGAMLFNNSMDRETVLELARNGELEYGYIPSRWNEKGTLSLIRIESTPYLFLTTNEAPEKIENFLKQAAAEEKRQGLTVAEHLTNRTETDSCIQDISKGALCSAAQKSFSASTAVGWQYAYSPQTHTFSKTANSLLGQETAGPVLDEPNEESILNQIYLFAKFQEREDTCDLQHGRWEQLSWQALYNLHEEAVWGLEYLNGRKNLSVRDDCRKELRKILQQASDAIAEKSRNIAEGCEQFTGEDGIQASMGPEW